MRKFGTEIWFWSQWLVGGEGGTATRAAVMSQAGMSSDIPEGDQGVAAAGVQIELKGFMEF